MSGIGGEKSLSECRDQKLALLGARPGGARRGVDLGIPGTNAERRRPRGVRNPARSPVQLGEELLIAVKLTQPLGVGQDPVGLMQRGQRRASVTLGDLTNVAIEQRLIKRPGAEQVISERQHVPVAEHIVVLCDDWLQLRLGPCRRIVPEQRVEHGHEMALARPERAGQESTPADPGRDGLRHQPQRLSSPVAC